MTETTIQGLVSTTGTTLYTVPTTKRARFITITATNPAAYVLSLSRFDKVLGTTVTVFSYSLSGGDSVIDQTGYFLREGDKLILTSSVNGTNYTAYFTVE